MAFKPKGASCGDEAEKSAPNAPPRSTAKKPKAAKKAGKKVSPALVKRYNMATNTHMMLPPK